MNEKSWHQASRHLALKLNAGLWLERALPAWAASSLVLASALLFWRGRTGGTIPATFWLLSASVLFLSSLVPWFLARSSFYNRADALVRLDDRLGLDNRLSAALAGVGSWPELPRRLPDIVRWRGSKLAPPALFSVTVLALSALVPVPPSSVMPRPVEAPLSWSEMERAIEAMREEELVAEEALDAFEERLDSLRDQPRDEWFSHGSLEAGDTLREELASEMRELAEGLERVESELAELQAMGEGELGDSGARVEKRRLKAAALEDDIDAIDLGRALPMSQKLSRQLKTLARESELRRLTEEELERIRSAKERLYHGLSTGRQERALAGLGSGEREGRGLGSRRARQGNGLGAGGINRGPGTAPIALSEERTELATDEIEALQNVDLSNAGFGETVAVQVKEHDVDVSDYTGSYDAGAVSSFGEGGDLVWGQSLTPSERRVLRKYFK